MKESIKISEFRKTKDKETLKQFYEQESYKEVFTKLKPKWKRKFKLIIKLMDLKPGEKVLDVGCAAKHLKSLIEEKGAIYTSFDLSKNFKPDIVGDAEDMHMIKDDSYDWVVFADILEHIPNPEKAVKEAYRVSKKVIAIVPNLYRLNSLTFLPSHPNDKHIIKLRPKQWLKFFYGASWNVYHVRGFFYCISLAFWPKMGIIDKFFSLWPFLKISDFFDRFLSTKAIFKYLGQELVIVAKK